MLKKIDTKEIMTCRAARVLYRTKYFIMVTTEVVDTQDNDLGYVIYTADTERELDTVPMDKYKGKIYGTVTGVAAEPYPQIGNTCMPADKVIYYD